MPALSIALLAAAAEGQQPTEEIEVIGQTPLGAGVNADQIAANVQVATGDEIREQRALGLADFMRRNLAGVFVNEAQSNPLQPDLQYRGFVGSPLLGLPQGIAVYQDGVRINEAFGDTVNWALIPDSAIDTVYLMPGSNPLFGLNALGGAISITTKDGFTSPGSRAKVYGGSFGRMGLEAETGGFVNDRLSYFVTGSYLEEDGWRAFSPTEATQLFGKFGWDFDATTLHLSMNLADTDLTGNGAAPVQLLELDRKAIFTRPDQTENELVLVNLDLEHEVSESLSLTGNFYIRRSDVSTYNGDDSDFEECETLPGFMCEEEDDEEELLLDRNDQPVVADDALDGATVNRTDTRQDGIGFGLQAAWTGDLGDRGNQLVAGVAYDETDIEFTASTELGMLDATRLAVPGGVFVVEAYTDLDARTRTISLFFTDTLSLSDRIDVTVSGRYNETDITLRDQLGTALNGDHVFSRFNPAVGLTARVGSGSSFYASYSESNRAPTPIELTCADELDPCRLPNAFLADPPLEQVVAETLEFGVRGQWRGADWSAGVFRTMNKDDILFISAGALTNRGYFDNVGRTRRDGVELSIQGQVGDRVSWFANFTKLEASFREFVALPSPNNPTAVDGEVPVEPGDSLPLVPDRLLKGGLRAQLTDRLTVGADFIGGGDFHMRGDEGNDVDRIGRYFVVNLRGDLSLSDRVRVFVNVDNLLDEEYETFGLFGEPDEVLGEEFDDSRYFSPAAPRAAWLGVEIEF
ncbi:MAG: TonB-dependent receptor [Gammaproteobacteria bacterium]|jgi:outer membrane receptor protein involved in Fe transport